MVQSVPSQSSRVIAPDSNTPINRFDPFPLAAIDQTLVSRFEQQVDRYPDQVAIDDGVQCLTYAELNQRVNQLAHALTAATDSQGQRLQGRPIVVLIEQGIDFITAMWAVLKSGNFYVPVDPNFPRDRNATIIQNSQAPLLLTSSGWHSLAQQLVPDQSQILLLEDALETCAGQKENLDLPVSPDAIANLIYTSGSTGQPKGVIQTHRNFLHNCRNYTNPMEITACDRAVLLHSCSVMGAVNGIFNALLNGATLYPYDVKTRGLADLPTWLVEQRITIYYSVVTLFRQLLDFVEAAPTYQNCCFPDLRLIRLGGEAVFLEDVVRYQRRFGDRSRLFVGLGATETGAIQLFITDKSTQIVGAKLPLGDSVDDMQVRLLDEQGRPVPTGEIGEICVQSPYLALGYWQDDARTKAAFLLDPEGGSWRIYRTGDLGKRDSQGQLIHQGRKDFQVKINGFRVEIAEIEASFLSLPSVKAVAVVGEQHDGRVSRLIAYVVPADSSQLAPETDFCTALRQQIATLLPGYMVPAGIVLLPELPQTPNGKVNRRVLPAASEADFQSATVAYRPPTTSLEKEVTNLWQMLLKVDRVGLDDNFFALGGESLIATQLLARIQLQQGIQLPLSQLFETPTVAELADAVSARLASAQSEYHQNRTDSTTAADAVSVEDRDCISTASVERCPLSFAQQRLWLLQQLEPESTAYHMSRCYLITEAVDVKVLRQAFGALLERHQVLRSRITASDDGIPFQQAADVHLFTLHLLDFQGQSAPKKLTDAFDDLRQRPFDLEREDLLRAQLIQLDAERFELHVVIHHIASDGWSMRIFERELSVLYHACLRQKSHSLPPLDIQYRDFAHWHRQWLSGDRFETQMAYWRSHLAAAPPLLNLPTDHPRPSTPTYRGNRYQVRLSAGLTAGLKALSQQQGATLFMTLLAAFKVLLARYSRQSDLVVGTPIANRPRPELEPLMGFFANMLPLRTDLSGNPSFTALLARVKQVALNGYEHQDLPFEKLVEALQPERDRSYSPIFQVMCVLQPPAAHHATAESAADPTLTLQPLPQTHSNAKYDLSLYLEEPNSEPIAQGITATFEYSSDLFEQATIERMAAHFQVLLAAVVEQPTCPIMSLPLLTPSERQQLLVDWNNTAVDFSQASETAKGDCIHQLFEQQVLRTPNAIALTFGGLSMTYRGLNQQANQLAHRLQSLGVVPNQLVGIAVDRSLEMVIALLGTLKSGAAYVPLDPSYPPERLSYMVSHAQLSLIVSEPAHAALFERQDSDVRVIDICAPTLTKEPTHNPASPVGADHSAYVIYTSGSTGKPKGVVIEHGAAVNFLQAMAIAPGLSACDRLLAVTTISFDIAVLELYLPLMVGATIVLANRATATNATALSRLISEADISVMQATPATWQMLIAGGWKGHAPLKMLCGGEALSRELADRLLERGHTLWNMYGPTEATVWTAACPVPLSPAPVPVAGPLANTQLYVVETPLENEDNDQNLSQLAPIGVPGEVFIGGEGLAREYLHQPTLTEQKFRPDPFRSESNARLYETGDLAYWRPDGTLEFLGRIDNQIKLRGFRIELGEIESALMQHGQVGRAVVVIRTAQPSDAQNAEPRLVAYWISDPSADSDKGVSPAELRDFLKGHLPSYMLPTAYIQLAAFPLTPNGKVNRRALPEPTLEATSTGANYCAPRTPLEQQLVGIWQSVLKVAPIGIYDNFFELGGHSLLAAQAIARIQSETSLRVPLAMLFDSPTVAAIASLASQPAQNSELELPPIESLDWSAGAPLSFAQQRMWLLHQLEPENNAYHITRTLRLEGQLDIAALKKAFTTLLERHAALRTRFVVVDGIPMQQLMSPPDSFDLPVVRLSDLTQDLNQYLTESAYQLFDLSSDYLLRAQVVCLSNEVYVLQFVMHHIASDGWSRGVFTRDLSELYAAYCRKQKHSFSSLPVQYPDFAHWQRQWLTGDVLDRHLAYWQQQLAGAPPVLALPTDYPRPAQPSYEGERVSFTLAPELTQKLYAFGRQQGVTLFMTLLAGFNVLLARYSGQTDILVGSPIANRPLPELENMVGLFLNTLVLRGCLDNNPTFEDFVQQIKQTALDAFSHQNLPFEQLLETLPASRDLSYSPWFQVLFVLQNTPQSAPDLTGIQVTPEPIEKPTAKFDLTLSMSERKGEIRGVLEYRRDLFHEQTAERLVNHFQVLLAAAMAEPTQSVSAYPLMTALEQEQMLREAKQSLRELVKIDEQCCVHTLFERQVQKTPNAIALQSNSTNLTYRALNEKANQLAHLLQQQGVCPDQLVGICLERSTDLIVGLLAILKAGGAYLPLDPTYPAERLALMLADAKPCAVLTNRQQRSRLTEALELGEKGHSTELTAPIICLDADSERVSQQSSTSPDCSVQSGHLAYVIYTSGSTGKPKGVMIEHRALVNFAVGAIETYGFSEYDRVLQFASVNFDAAVEEIFGALCSGATLVLRSEEMLRSPADFLEKCNQLDISVLDLPTAYWHQLAAALSDEQLLVPSRLRLTIIGGEAAKPDALARWQNWLLQAGYIAENAPAVVNTYGPTEATVVATSARLPWQLSDSMAAQSTLPIGGGMPGVETLILDEQQQMVPLGVAGELYLGGAGLARGYLGRPQLTAERFIIHPFRVESDEKLYKTGDRVRLGIDGQLYYMGRADDQVKLRGFRIELGEVEAAIAQYPAVQQSAVIVREDTPGDPRLVAYVVLKGKSEWFDDKSSDGKSNSSPPSGVATDLREQLKQQLPAYMVPAAYVVLDALPLTPNLKLDKKALPKPAIADFSLSAGYVPPQTSVEQTLCEIWQTVLSVERVGVEDNFFELGGHSLLAGQMMARIQTELGVALPLATVFDSPTVSAMASIIASDQQPKNSNILPTNVLARPAHVDIPLSLAQQRIWFLQQLDPQSSAYHMLRILRLKGELNLTALRQSLTTLVVRHEALRTCFVAGEDEPTQVILPPDCCELRIVDLSETSTQTEISPNSSSVLEQQLQATAKQPFDLSSEPMLRAVLFCLSETEHVLQLVIHHIACDGWSMGILTQELSALYAAYSQHQPDPLLPLPIQYADFALWQRQWLAGDVMARQLTYWQRQLADAPACLTLPTDFPRPTQLSNRGHQLTFALTPEVSTGLKQLSQQQGTTLFMTLLAAFNVLLYRYSGQTDILLGSPIANRPVESLESLVGLFLNTLVLRTDLSESPSFEILLKRVRQTALDAYAHQDVPFEQLLETLKPPRDLSISPWFQVMFILQNTPYQSQQLDGLTIQTEHVRKTTAKFDLTLSMRERSSSPTLEGTLEYSTDLFTQSTIERLIAHFQTLLSSIIAAPDCPIDQLPMLSEDARSQLLARWMQPKSESLSTDAYQSGCVHDWFERQAQKTPDAIALIDHPHSLTYHELNQRAAAVAQQLTKLGMGFDQRVGIAIPRCQAMIVALLGILKAGGAYVPLDPTYPTERLTLMIEDASPRAIITLEGSNSLPSVANDIPHLQLTSDGIATCSLSDLETTVSTGVPESQHLAYVIYTSGSTGRPKGVMVQHGALSSFVRSAIARYDLSPSDRVLQFASINFDAAIEEIFPTLCSGAALVLRSDDMVRSPAHFLDQCQSLSLTVLDLPTAYWHQLTAALSDKQASLTVPAALRLVIIGGEAARPDALERWQRWLLSAAKTTPTAAAVKLVNTYGPTEATVVATAYDSLPTAPAPVGSVPIGQPLSHVQSYVLDAHMQPVPTGLTGELYIGGDSLAKGYLNLPELTCDRFVDSPFKPGERLYKTGDMVCELPDGNLRFVGRQDSQVKIRGFRVELEAVSAALETHDAILQAVVVAREATPGDLRLVAYVVPQAGLSLPDTAILRQHLQQQLPNYMIPAAFVSLEAMPLTPSNKLNMKALPTPDWSARQQASSFVAPESSFEKEIAAIWSKFLKVEQISIHDNFFDLGGHSLLAAQIIDQIQTDCGVTLPLAALFETATVAALAAQCEQVQPSADGNAPQKQQKDSLLVLLKQGSLENPPIFLVHEADGDVSVYGHLAGTLEGDRTVYGIKPQAKNGFPMVHSRIEAIAADYRKQIQSVQPHGPYTLGGLCIGGVLAFEIALQLQEQGETIALVALLDSIPKTAKKRPEYYLRLQQEKEARRKARIAKGWHNLQQGPNGLLQLSRAIAHYTKRRVEYELTVRQNADLANLFQQKYDGAQHPCPPQLASLTVRQVLVNAVKDYTPRAKLDASVLLIKASYGVSKDKPAYIDMYADPTFTWDQKVTRPLQVHQVSGGHSSMLGPRKISELATILKNAMIPS